MNKNELLIELSESSMAKIGKEEFAQQSLPQKVFSGIWEVESEVNNGGFSQYFSNDSAESASFVVQALETIGAPRTASICNRAILTAFPTGLPTTVESIRSVATDFSDEILAELEPLDQEFFSYPHNLTDLLFKYVSAHPEHTGETRRRLEAAAQGLINALTVHVESRSSSKERKVLLPHPNPIAALERKAQSDFQPRQS